MQRIVEERLPTLFHQKRKDDLVALVRGSPRDRGSERLDRWARGVSAA